MRRCVIEAGEKIRFEQSRLYFRDTAGKFDVVKEKAHRACRHKYALTICSLTARGEKEPTHLFVKITPIGKRDGYMTARLDQKAAEAEVYRYLGLGTDVKMIVVRHSTPGRCACRENKKDAVHQPHLRQSKSLAVRHGRSPSAD